MRTLSRYIFREILQFFWLSLAVFTGILVIARMLRLTSLVVNRGVSLLDVATIFISIVPTFLEVALPVSSLLAVMLALGRLSADSEIIVIRASGISLGQLIKPVLVFAVCAAALNFFVSFQLRPWGYFSLAESLFRVASSRSSAGLDQGVFNEMGKLILYAEHIDHETGSLTRVLIDDRRNPDNRQVIVAQHGKIVSDADKRTINFLLWDGSIHVSPADGTYNLTDFESNVIIVSPDQLNASEEKGDLRPREMFMPQLHAEKDRLKALMAGELVEAPKDPNLLLNPASAAELLTEYARRMRSVDIEVIRKYSMPFACLVLALLAMPLGIQPARSHNSLGAALSVLIGMAVVVLYYVLLSLAITFAQDGTIAAAYGLWFPNLVFLACAVFGLQRMGSERWSTIVHAIEDTLTSLGKKFGLTRTA